MRGLYIPSSDTRLRMLKKEDPRGCEGQANGNVLKQSLVR